MSADFPPSSLRQPWNLAVNYGGLQFIKWSRGCYLILPRHCHASSVAPRLRILFFRHRWVLCIWFALSEKPQSLKLLTNRCKSLLSLFIPRGRFPLVGRVISAWSEYPLGTRNTELSHFCSSFIETIVTRLASHCSSVLAMQTREAMTIAACANFCDSQPVPYRFMGITDGFQCCASSSAQDMRLFVFGN